MQVFYRLDGELPAPQEFPEVPGWRGIGPVVVGNAAVDQLQLSVFGDVFDMVRLYVDHGHVLDAGTGRLLAGDGGPGVRRVAPPRRRPVGAPAPGALHVVQAQLLAGAAVRRPPGADGPDPRRPRPVGGRGGADRALGARALLVRRAAARSSWYPGTDELDTSILLHAGSGFDVGPRMSSTIDALRAELGVGPLLYRYTGAAKEEAASVAPSFWAVSALHAVGRTVQARALMDELVPLANDVGVLAEMIDPADGAFLGNLPQGLSHLALIGAALDLEEEPEVVREARDRDG